MPDQDVPGYPRTLRLTGHKLAAVYVGLPLLAVIIATLVTMQLREGVYGLADTLTVAAFALVVPGALLLLWSGTQSYTNIWPDRVEVFNGFTLRTIAASGLRGYRRRRNQRTVDLVPSDPQAPTLRVPLSFLSVRAAVPWSKALHNLEIDDLAERRNELDNDGQLGKTPQARRLKARQLRSAATALNALAWGVAVWAWIFPRPYELVLMMAVALPLAALAIHLWTRGFFRLDLQAENPTPSIAALYYAPALALFLRSITDFNAIDYLPTLAVAAGVALLLTFITVIDNRKMLQHKWAVTGFVTGSFCFAIGLLSFANQTLDHGSGQAFAVKVEDAFVTSGKAHLNTFVLAPWGPFERAAEAYVRTDVYDSIDAGDVVCVTLHDGAFGWRWFDVTKACSPSHQ